MDTRQAYNRWAEQYDTNVNKTRDLEAIALRRTLANKTFNRILEIGCGTGKNTEWLQTISREMVAVDLSEEMLAKAKEKITAASVSFRQADITQDWTFAEGPFDLITFSLVLEHIEDLHPIFDKAAPCFVPMEEYTLVNFIRLSNTQAQRPGLKQSREHRLYPVLIIMYQTLQRLLCNVHW